ncbi:CDP-glucose 4,6-dehydratase [Fictibacillus macauensis ZFHKF-1]|uniref:CDP-glucose 4,6-dehydratase n=1 Tax=Fictibacillus macauensis ZFHKF-1 TaxID=1196324 RepID=I8AGT7_9BACL|nr:CDP-glucose 4,6-dehydratase [Fictibacillus macauensis]EIT84624.1 CDP-glucose 4,6-dehydratase [Fictibacillus macauensis ZFHKF-1]
MNAHFWRNKTVLLTGHTGFKGSWLAIWLHLLGANVVGYALPANHRSLYRSAALQQYIQSYEGDISDRRLLLEVLSRHKPDLVFHLAAQPLVRLSYEKPVETFETNVMGTLHLLEALRQCDTVKAIVNVTSDKCYRNDGRFDHEGFSEGDPLGGKDPYSASKACAELVTQAYAASFFNEKLGVATARAGNVIGGGDWSQDRLLPDLMKAHITKQPIVIRYPKATRPWQHVLDPLYGYLLLAQHLYERGTSYSGAWNFGPYPAEAVSVEEVIGYVNRCLSVPIEVQQTQELARYEAPTLQLQTKKAVQQLGWLPKLTLPEAIVWSVRWYEQCAIGKDMYVETVDQIKTYERMVKQSDEGKSPLS